MSPDSNHIPTEKPKIRDVQTSGVVLVEGDAVDWSTLFYLANLEKVGTAQRKWLEIEREAKKAAAEQKRRLIRVSPHPENKVRVMTYACEDVTSVDEDGTIIDKDIFLELGIDGAQMQYPTHDQAQKVADRITALYKERGFDIWPE